MKNKIAKIGVVLGGVSVFLFLCAQFSYQNIDNGTRLYLASYLADIASFLSSNSDSGPVMKASGFSITEELSIYLFVGLSFLISIICIGFGLASLKAREDIRFTFAALLAGQCAFILFDIKLALAVLLVTSILAAFLLRSRKT